MIHFFRFPLIRSILSPMQGSHILQDFDHAISALRGEVLSMAGKARHNLERAILALMERNVEIANAVIADDDEVDEHERHIDRLGMEILVRFHPMATDLRMVVSSMKISMNLERISDHATSIAKRAKKISASSIHFIYKTDTWYFVFISLSPYGFRLWLYSGNSTKQSYCSVKYS